MNLSFLLNAFHAQQSETEINSNSIWFLIEIKMRS